MSRVDRRSAYARAMAAPPTTYSSPTMSLDASRRPSAVRAAMISARSIRDAASDALESARVDEDTPAPERGGRSRDGYRAEPRYVADEPEAIEETIVGR